ncbi:MAG: hypothetical protein KY451_06440 [Actinobacteria bacterium]|nr:hypothetical protein [Actinomycetota bacterium]MBW3646456.1 hypothetical protein [Actinomycetota bacterium]
MTETREQRAERVYAQAEQSLVAVNERRVRRGPETLVAVLVVLCLAVGVVAAVDLRRLMTPRGTALAWTGAAVFGDCTAYRVLSVPDTGAGEERTDGELCSDLIRSTEQARREPTTIRIELLAVEMAGRQATAQMRVTRRDDVDTTELQLMRRGDGWVVLRTADTCAAVGCA